MAEAWLINPHRKRRTKAKSRPRHKRYKAKTKRGFSIMAKPKRRNPRRRRHHRRRNPVRMSFSPRRNPRRRHRRRRHNPPAFFANRRRRHYRRNPPALRTLGTDLMWGTAGLVTTKFVGNTITPMVGATITGQPLMRIAWKLAMAYVSAWGLSQVGGDGIFTPAFVGGSMDAAQDFVTNYITPLVPQIAGGGGMGVYYGGPRVPARTGMAAYYRPAPVRHEVVV